MGLSRRTRPGITLVLPLWPATAEIYKKIGNWIETELDGATIFLGNEENDSTDGNNYLSVTVGLGMRES
jgi:hypothetical protein